MGGRPQTSLRSPRPQHQRVMKKPASLGVNIILTNGAPSAAGMSAMNAATATRIAEHASSGATTIRTMHGKRNAHGRKRAVVVSHVTQKHPPTTKRLPTLPSL